MRRINVIPPGMEIIRERFNYNPGVIVDNTLYIAGQVGRDENLQVLDGANAQYVQAFENVKKVLSAAGASFDNVVDMVTYHVDIGDLPNFITVKDRYFTNEMPAWTGIGVSALAMPGLLIEIKCVAKLDTMP